MTLTENHIKVIDIIVKGLVGTAITAALTIYGFRIEDARRNAENEGKALQAAIELTSKQKDLDVDLSMRMFGTLMSYYFQKDGSPQDEAMLEDQMLLLRLVALNFQDVPIQLKPLFEKLDSHLNSDKEKQQLRAIAQEVSRRQAFRLTVESGFDSGPIRVKKGDELTFDSLLTKVKVEDVGEDSIAATVVSEIAKNRSIGPFQVTYYDFPIVDNIKLGELRVALLLLEIGQDYGVVRFIAFPKHLATDRFDIKELSRAFRDKSILQ